jgi:hypothetical protein
VIVLWIFDKLIGNLLMDCTDIKAILSGLVDDELASDVRHDAERHLVECKPCRSLVNEAEGVNELIAIDAHAMIAPALPEDFEAAVLSRTVFARSFSLQERQRRWTSYVGWLAAAACLGLAGLIWTMDRQIATQNHVAHNDANEPRMPAVSYYTGSNLQNRTYEGAQPVNYVSFTNRSDNDGDEDADALESASMLLSMIAEADLNSFTDVECVRRAAEYDRLLPRLARARQEVTSSDRPVVLAAESVLLRAVNGPLSIDDLRELNQSVKQMDLSHAVHDISSRMRTDIAL